MKKGINAPERVIEGMLRGMERAHSGLLRLIPDRGVLVQADAPVHNKVALVSGGGSGHEPTHGGYVGPGMFDDEEMKEYLEAPCEVAAGRPF